MPLVAMTITAITFLIVESGQSSLKKFAYTFIGLLGIIGLIFTPVLSERFSEITRSSTSYEKGDLLSSTDLRLGIWKCTAETVSENGIWGVGVELGVFKWSLGCPNGICSVQMEPGASNWTVERTWSLEGPNRAWRAQMGRGTSN